MYICKNCLTTSEDHVDQCGTCKMKGQMIQDNTVSIRSSIVRKQKVRCTNCGCDDTGDGTKCKVCHFPIGKKETTTTLKQQIK